MLSDEVINKVTERLVRRIEQTNTYILEKMGESVAKIRTLTPTQAQQLAQIMRYGGDYDKIAKALSKMSKLNIQDIYKIFEEVAKSDYTFAKQFYDYRKIKYIPYNKNESLKRQVDAIASITANEYNNLTKTLGFAIKVNGKTKYQDITTTYQNLLDEAVLSVSEGKYTFDEGMYRIVKNLASSGVKTIDYASGRSYRLDSAVRMCMNSGLKRLRQETQEIFGREFDADGIEITTHENPAPDHEEAQGRQFSKKRPSENELSEWEKLQQYGIATTYDGITIDLHEPLKSGKIPNTFRPIGTLNCQHDTFNIVLGVSKPLRTDEQLQQIIERNEKGFDYEDKHYTMYEGEQLQRKIELELRKAKDTQIMARTSNIDEAQMAQARINKLSKKYSELLKASGLQSKIERARVPGYHKISVK